MGESIWADRALTLMWHIVARRAWGLSKHSTPPESLANLLSNSDAKRSRAAEQLRSEHKHFLLFERSATMVDDAETLREADMFLDADVVRIVCEFYARDRYDPSSRSGSWALRALLQSFADHKLIEDVHQPLRLDARANVNRRLSPLHIQDVVLESDALDGRNIHHSCRATKEYWCQNLGRAKKARRVSHKAHRRRLPNKWSTIMKIGDKT